VSYSDAVKWRILVGHYGCDPDRVFVVRHGTNTVDHLITVQGTLANDAATKALCETLLKSALCKAVDAEGDPEKGSGRFPFLFYASQFRPSKNIINILRAYEYLLRRKFVDVKLVLTGNPRVAPEVAEFIQTHNLRNDVLCLHGLTNQEWAACYKLAALAVNPSLSEGGCPFTFSEALSVGTPVVMARIAVTEEVITDPEVQSCTFFDPFDWRDMADRIHWALSNRSHLLATQKRFYDDVISRRTWHTVLDEYIEILEQISLAAEGQGAGTAEPKRLAEPVPSI
jgi:hypothetical protein